MATIVLFVCGYHDITVKRLLEILQFAPSGSSTKTILHYLQCHRSKKLIPYEETGIFDKRQDKTVMLKSPKSNNENIRSNQSECSDDGYKSAQSTSSKGSHDSYNNEVNGKQDENSIDDMEEFETTHSAKDRDIYSLQRIFIPISIWWAEADWAASKRNVSRIVMELPNVVNCWKLKKPTCGHLDFLWGRTGCFYQDLNKHLDDIYPSDWKELEDQLNYVHDNITPNSQTDNAVLWYAHAMSANLRLSAYEFKDTVETIISSINIF